MTQIAYQTSLLNVFTVYYSHTIFAHPLFYLLNFHLSSTKLCNTVSEKFCLIHDSKYGMHASFIYLYMFLCFPPSNLSLFIVVYCLVLCRKIYRVACLKILVGCSSDSGKRCNQNWHTILSWRLCEQIVPCLRMGLLERKNK